MYQVRSEPTGLRRTWRAHASIGILGPLVCLAASSVSLAETVREEQLLAGPCMNCHGPEGRSPGVIPSIAGLSEVSLKTKLIAFKSDTPPAGTTIMNRLAKGYSDAQIESLARYYAQMKPAGVTGSGAKQ